MSDRTSLGDRMKGYEDVSDHVLTGRMPMIIRLDGRAFHTFTRGFEKPWDIRIKDAMEFGTRVLLADIQGSKFAYSQSDEVSILVTDYDRLESQPWFGKRIQKIASVSASIMSVSFNLWMRNTILVRGGFDVGIFDARCFVLPREEVCNYFIWRQKDAIRNSISSLAQANFSAKSLKGQDCETMKKRLLDEKGIDWDDLDPWKKFGWAAHWQAEVFTETSVGQIGSLRVEIMDNLNLFTEDREFIEEFVTPCEVFENKGMEGGR